MVGRRPKPTAIKEMMGNPGKRPLNSSEPKPSGHASCPKRLDKEAKKEWRRVCRQLETMGLLTSVDRNSLAAYCICWSHAVKAEEDVGKLGHTIVISRIDSKGVRHVVGVKKNPALSVVTDMLALMRQYAVEFGMTPSSRSRIEAPTKQNDEA